MCISAIAMAITAAGTAYSTYNSIQASEASQRAESLRKEQMKLEAERNRRKTIREAMAARAVALSNITQAGGSDQGSSATGGAFGQISNSLGNNINDLSQSVRIGAGIFDANAAQSEAQGQMAIGQAISSMGKDIFAAGPKINAIGETLFGRQESGIPNWTNTVSLK